MNPAVEDPLPRESVPVKTEAVVPIVNLEMTDPTTIVDKPP